MWLWWCDYVIILVGETILIAAQVGSNSNNGDEEVVFNNCAPFTDCVNEINNPQIDNANYIDVIMPMYNSIEYYVNYSKKVLEVYGKTIEMFQL